MDTSSTQDATYKFMEANTNTCGETNAKITSSAGCQAASTATGLTYKGTENMATWPAGCYKYRGTMAYFNQHATGKAHSSGIPLCLRDVRLVKTSVECKSSDARMGGTSETLTSCAAKCQAAHPNCKFFIIGKGSKAGNCYHEKTSDATCSEGWEDDQYDFYESIQVQVAVSSPSPPPVSNYGYGDDWKGMDVFSCQRKFLTRRRRRAKASGSSLADEEGTTRCIVSYPTKPAGITDFARRRYRSLIMDAMPSDEYSVTDTFNASKPKGSRWFDNCDEASECTQCIAGINDDLSGNNTNSADTTRRRGSIFGYHASKCKTKRFYAWFSGEGAGFSRRRDSNGGNRWFKQMDVVPRTSENKNRYLTGKDLSMSRRRSNPQEQSDVLYEYRFVLKKWSKCLYANAPYTSTAKASTKCTVMKRCDCVSCREIPCLSCINSTVQKTPIPKPPCSCETVASIAPKVNGLMNSECAAH